MLNKKLNKIGRKLNVSEKEIAAVKKSEEDHSKAIFQWFISALVSAISFTVGFFTGRSVHSSNGGYPFAAGLTAVFDPSDRIKIQDIQKIGGILLIILPIITFLFGREVGIWMKPKPPTFSIGPTYGVYGQNNNNKRG